MKKTLGLFVAFCAILSVSANVYAKNDLWAEAKANNQTLFEKIGDLFSSSETSVPDPVSLLGTSWRGRCFWRKSPNKAIGAMYYLRTCESDRGPLGNNLYAAISVWYSRFNPNYVDTLTIDDVHGRKPDSYNWYQDAEITPEGIRTTLFGHDDYIYLKSSGNYLVAVTVDGSDDVSSPETHHTRCYYFLPEYTP